MYLVLVEKDNVYYATEVTLFVNEDGLRNPDIVKKLDRVSLAQFIGNAGLLPLATGGQLVFSSAEEMINNLSEAEHDIYYVLEDGTIYYDYGVGIVNIDTGEEFVEYETFVKEKLFYFEEE